MIRLYFNAKEEWPLIWSVDEGDPSTEQKVAKVNIFAQGETVFTRGGIAQPRAWLAFENCYLTILGDVAEILPKCPSSDSSPNKLQ